jgi:hypothetical protein
MIKMSPTEPSFNYDIIQRSDTQYLILFLAWQEYTDLLHEWGQQNFQYRCKIIYRGWPALTEEESKKYDDSFDVIYEINFENIEDSIQFKLVWG